MSGELVKWNPFNLSIFCAWLKSIKYLNFRAKNCLYGTVACMIYEVQKCIQK